MAVTRLPMARKEGAAGSSGQLRRSFEAGMAGLGPATYAIGTDMDLRIEAKIGLRSRTGQRGWPEKAPS